MTTGTSVVIGEHTLGVVYGDRVQILRASVLKGSPYAQDGVVMLPEDNVRAATPKDFVEFNVVQHADYFNHGVN